jgi:paraquat-inducible protein B
VGESLVKLFSVRSSIEEALMLPYQQTGGRQVLLADVFYKDLSNSTKRKLKKVAFHAKLKENNSATDSALWFLYEHINKNVLSASKPDKKQTFITVNCKHTNDTLALRFAEAMIEVVTEKYIRSITRNVRRSLAVLRKEADSIQWVMNRNIARNASNMDYNINPLQQSAKIEQNKSLIDMQISISLYGEIIKNLKLAELALKKQTPLIEIVDVPHFPLKKSGWPLWQFIVVGALAGFGLALGILYFTGKFD